MGWMRKALFAFGALAAMLSSAAVRGDEALDRAIALTTEQRYAEARELLDSILERDPDYSYARLLHGILRARAGGMEEAVEIFEGLRRDHPDMPEPYNNLAVIYAVQGRLDEAREVLVAALERQPNAVAYANLGDVYTSLAREAYERAREFSSAGDARSGAETAAAGPIPAMPSGPSANAAIGKPADAATQAHSAVPDSGDAAVPSPEPGSAATGTASATYSGATSSSVICAHAGGFKDRRSVADAAKWLRSQGAEIVEVRRDDHEVAKTRRVYLPPFATRAEATEKLREIRDRGVGDVALIKTGALENGISFGVFSRADNMRQRVSTLHGLGYDVQFAAADAEIVERYLIKARPQGGLTDLKAVWALRFAGNPLQPADCD